jgi:hypothetical protein
MPNDTCHFFRGGVVGIPTTHVEENFCHLRNYFDLNVDYIDVKQPYIK